jgi:hypothetical protein
VDVTRRLFVAGSVIPAIGSVGLARAQDGTDRAIRDVDGLPDIASLRDHAPPTAEAASPSAVRAGQLGLHVRGYHQAGDGGGGDFTWDPDGEDEDDGGTVIRPLGRDGAGRWRRIGSAGVDVRWFGAKADGSGDAAPAINAALRVAARLKVSLLLSGAFRLEHSLVFPAPVTVEAAATLIAAPGDYNAIPYWTGQPSGQSCLIDLAYGRFSSVTGRLVIRAETPGKPPETLAAIGSSKGLYSELLPNAEGRGGSNTTWQSIEVYDLDFGFFSPGRGAPVPSGLAERDRGLAKADWQPSAVARGDGTYLALRYEVGDHVLFGRGVYVCVATGTPVTGPVQSAPGPGVFTAAESDGSGWEYVTDEPVQGVRPWAADAVFVAGDLAAAKTGIYRARRAGAGGAEPPEHQGTDAAEAAPPPWRSGETPELSSFRQSGRHYYRLVARGSGATEGEGPRHDDDRPQADANGWGWAYAGPATPPTWRYLRKPNYCAAGVGMVIGHFWAGGVAHPWTSAATATDDSFIAHFRAQNCRDTAIRINGGQFNAAAVFIHGTCGRYAGGDLKQPGAAAIQNFGSYQADSTYIAGEWGRGIVLGQGSQTDTTFKADGDFKTSTGVAIEAHPGATRLLARIRSASYNAIQPVADFLYVTGDGAFAEGATLTGPQGQSLILSTQRAGAETLVIHRPLSGAIRPGDAVTDGRARGLVSETSRRHANTLAAGLVGIPQVPSAAPRGAGVCRQIELVLPTSQSQMLPYRAVGPSLGPSYQSQDWLTVQASDGPAVYRFRSGMLVRSAEDGYVDLGEITGITDINPIEGATQLVRVAAPRAQIRLPSTLEGSPDVVTRGCHLQLEIDNPGVAETLFFSGAAHPPVSFVGGTPLWPRSGRSVVHLWLYNGVPWRAAVLGGRRRVQPVAVEDLWPPGAGLVDASSADDGAGYPCREFRADGDAAWFSWLPPAEWNRGPIRFRYRWARPAGAGDTVACGLQGIVVSDGMSLATKLGPEMRLADEGKAPDTLYAADESPDLLLPGAERWAPGASVRFRFRRLMPGDGKNPLSVPMRLLGIDLLYDEG